MHDLVAHIREHTGDRCFACGRDNPLGLGIDDFTVVDGEVHATFTPRPDHRGLASVLHGGLTATALDEVMVWAGMLLEGVVSVTGTMDVRYRRPVTTGTTLYLTGRVDQRSGSRLRLSGSLADPTGVCASAAGLYVVSETVDELLG